MLIQWTKVPGEQIFEGVAGEYKVRLYVGMRVGVWILIISGPGLDISTVYPEYTNVLGAMEKAHKVVNGYEPRSPQLSLELATAIMNGDI